MDLGLGAPWPFLAQQASLDTGLVSAKEWAWASFCTTVHGHMVRCCSAVVIDTVLIVGFPEGPRLVTQLACCCQLAMVGCVWVWAGVVGCAG